MEYKTTHKEGDQLDKKLEFDHITKWYMHKQESFLNIEIALNFHEF